MSRDTETVTVLLELTVREAEMLTIAANELYHRMRATNEHEIYGALIVNENVLAARSLWNKIEEITKINDWD